MAGTTGVSPIYFYLVVVLVALFMGALSLLAQHVRYLIAKHFLEERHSSSLPPDHIELPLPIEEELKRRRKHA